MYQVRLRPEANSFIPGSLFHNSAVPPRKGLNPSAGIFIPKSKLNANAISFVPFFTEEVKGRLDVSGKQVSERLTKSESQLSSLHLYTIHDSLPETVSSKFDAKNKADPIRINLPQTFPISITRSYVESGQLVRKAGPALHILSLRDFPSEGELRLTHKPAGAEYFDGATEDQRQKHRVQQNCNRVLQYDWRGRKLCANGSVMPADFSDMTKEAQEAEYDARPYLIHHFNWLGNPVYCKSNTPPAVSFAIILSLSRPRGLSFGLNKYKMREAALFNNAMTFIDPIYYFGGNPDLVLRCKGTKLQEIITGDVGKIYSSHGYWDDKELEYYSEDEDRPELDPLDGIYYDSDDIVLNGWFENFQLPTVRTFIEADYSASKQQSLEKKLSLTDRLPFIPSPSRLCQVVSRHELDNEDVLDVFCSSLNPASSPFISAVMMPSERMNESARFESRLEDWADESEELAVSSMACPGTVLSDADCTSLLYSPIDAPLPEISEDSIGTYDEEVELELLDDIGNEDLAILKSDIKTHSNDPRPASTCENAGDCSPDRRGPTSEQVSASISQQLGADTDVMVIQPKKSSDSLANLENLSPISEFEIEEALGADRVSYLQADADKQVALSVKRPETPLSKYDTSVLSEVSPSSSVSSSDDSLFQTAEDLIDSLQYTTTTNEVHASSRVSPKSMFDVFTESDVIDNYQLKPEPLFRSVSLYDRQPLQDITQLARPRAIRARYRNVSKGRNWCVVTSPDTSPVKEDDESGCHSAVSQVLSPINYFGSQGLATEEIPPVPPRSQLRPSCSRISHCNKGVKLDATCANSDNMGHGNYHLSDLEITPYNTNSHISSLFFGSSAGICSLNCNCKTATDVKDCALQSETNVVSTRTESDILLPIPSLPAFTSIGPRPQQKAKAAQIWRKPRTISVSSKFTLSTTPVQKVEQIKNSFDKFQKGLKGVFKKQMNVLH